MTSDVVLDQCGELGVVVQLGTDLVDLVDRDLLPTRVTTRSLHRARPHSPQPVPLLARAGTAAARPPALAVAHLQRSAPELRHRRGPVDGFDISVARGRSAVGTGLD